MIVGSYASNYYGRPRSTQDVDIFLIWNPDNIEAFTAKLGPDFFADKDDLKSALIEQRMSNIIHTKTGFKADLSPLGSGSYNKQAFSRRRQGDLFGQKVYFAAPEDIILTKLLWAKQSESQRQIEDAKGIMQVQDESLDKDYLTLWAQ
ncbi:hypothetical protein ACFL6Y_11970, partial [Elusimicrobiota bacterium]